MGTERNRRLMRLLCWCAALALATTLRAQSVYTWNADGGGNWNTTNSTGWNTNGFPSAIGDTAYFTNDITGNRTITINVSTATVGTLYLADAVPSHNWTISGTSTMKFDVASGSAMLYSASGSNAITAPIQFNDPLIVSVTGVQMTFSEIILGSKGLTVTNGLLILSKAYQNDAFDPITIASGATLRVNNNCGVLDNARVTIAAGGVYDYQSARGDYLGYVAGNGSVLLSTGSQLIMGGNPATFSGTISGPGSIRWIGSTFTLNGSNAFTGATYITGGRVKVQNGLAILDTAPIVFGASDATASTSSVFEVASSETVGSLNSAYGTGAIDLDSGATLTTGANDTSTTFAGPLRSSGNLVKTGAGTFTLTGTNFYTGTTIVSNGTLLVNGYSTNGGNYTVVSGATLGGSGLIDPSASKTVTVAAGAVLLPGGTNGTLTIGSATGNNNVQLNGALCVTGDASRDVTTPWLRIEGSLLLGPSSSVSGTTLSLLNNANTYVLASYSGSRSNALASTAVDSRWTVRYDDANHRLLLAPLNNTVLLLR